jgi:hypothetical protein
MDNSLSNDGHVAMITSLLHWPYINYTSGRAASEMDHSSDMQVIKTSPYYYQRRMNKVSRCSDRTTAMVFNLCRTLTGGATSARENIIYLDRKDQSTTL